MNILFIHQNFPAQYKHLARNLAADRTNRVIAIMDVINQNKHMLIEGIRYLPYASPKGASQETHHYIRNLERGVRRGQAVSMMALKLRNEGFIPDVICVNTGWGEAMYLKDIFHESKVLSFFEFYYHAKGVDIGFDPEFPIKLDDHFRVRTKNTINLLSLNACDWGITPTRWQWSTLPPEYRQKISIIFDGIDTRQVAPRKGVELKIKGHDQRLTAKQEIITFVNRNLEPYRGFHTFMRAVPDILKQRPDAIILIVGGDSVSYGRQPKKFNSYKEQYLEEINHKEIDLSRVLFLGKVPYNYYLSILQISTVHVYLTYPFVLSWSMLEAMSTECIVVGSKTPPVEEVIKSGENGLLVDFFQPAEIVKAVNQVFDHPDRMIKMRKKARKTIIERYDLQSICLPEQMKLITDLSSGAFIASRGLMLPSAV